MGDITVLFSREESIDNAVRSLEPRTAYRRARYRECIGLVYKSNIFPYNDEISNKYKKLIDQETNELVSRYIDLLSDVKQSSVIDDIDFHASVVGFVTSCLENLENFSSIMRRTDKENDSVQEDYSLELIERYSQKLSFLKWFSDFYNSHLSENPGLARKLVSCVNKVVNKSDELVIPINELKDIILESSSSLQDNS